MQRHTLIHTEASLHDEVEKKKRVENLGIPNERLLGEGEDRSGSTQFGILFSPADACETQCKAAKWQSYTHLEAHFADFSFFSLEMAGFFPVDRVKIVICALDIWPLVCDKPWRSPHPQECLLHTPQRFQSGLGSHVFKSTSGLPLDRCSRKTGQW